MLANFLWLQYMSRMLHIAVAGLQILTGPCCVVPDCLICRLRCLGPLTWAYFFAHCKVCYLKGLIFDASQVALVVPSNVGRPFLCHQNMYFSQSSFVIAVQVALVGAPNVGKSSLVNVLSSGVPEVCDYPFTTRSIKMGHFFIDGHRHQVHILCAAMQ